MEYPLVASCLLGIFNVADDLDRRIRTQLDSWRIDLGISAGLLAFEIKAQSISCPPPCTIRIDATDDCGIWLIGNKIFPDCRCIIMRSVRACVAYRVEMPHEPVLHIIARIIDKTRTGKCGKRRIRRCCEHCCHDLAPFDSAPRSLHSSVSFQFQDFLVRRLPDGRMLLLSTGATNRFDGIYTIISNRGATCNPSEGRYADVNAANVSGALAAAERSERLAFAPDAAESQVFGESPSC